MSYKINIVDQMSQTYKRDEISCYEKPTCIILDSYNKYNSQYYLIYKKIIEAYRLKNLEKDEEGFIKEYLGLKLIIISDEKDIDSKIKYFINLNIPVLIEGNVIEWFCSSFYKRQDHMHLFLINGYDDRGLYNILEADPWIPYRGEQYISQVIEASTIKKIFEALENGDIFIIEKSDFERKTNLELLEYVLNLYLFHTEIYPFSEEEVIDRIRSGLDDSNYDYGDDVSLLVNKPKIKRVLFCELNYMANLIASNFDKLEEFEKLIHNYYNCVENENNLLVRQIYRNEKLNEKNLLDTIVKFEKRLRDLLVELKNHIKIISGNTLEVSSDILEATESLVIFENNSDGIMTFNDNIYYFKFNNQKTYNSWDEKNSPKVILGEKIHLNDKFYFQTTLEIDPDYEEIGFLAGISFDTVKNEAYSWGVHCGSSLVLEHTGVNANMYKTEFKALKVSLYIECYDTLCNVGFINDNGDKIGHNFDVSERIMRVGIGCKTWVNGGVLKLKYTNNFFDLCNCKRETN